MDSCVPQPLWLEVMLPNLAVLVSGVYTDTSSRGAGVSPLQGDTPTIVPLEGDLAVFSRTDPLNAVVVNAETRLKKVFHTGTMWALTFDNIGDTHCLTKRQLTGAAAADPQPDIPKPWQLSSASEQPLSPRFSRLKVATDKYKARMRSAQITAVLGLHRKIFRSL